MLARNLCKEKGCVEEASVGAYCQPHYIILKQKDKDIQKRQIERAFSQGFSLVEISELTHLPITQVYDMVEEIKAEITPWLQADISERAHMIMNELIKRSEIRKNELWVTAQTNDKEKVKALIQHQKEDEFLAGMMQSLGLLPKAAQKVSIQMTAMEAAVLANDKEGRIIDIETDPEDEFSDDDMVLLQQLDEGSKIRFDD